MNRSFVGLCLVAMMSCAAYAEAQSGRRGRGAREEERKGTKATEREDGSAATATGCLEPGSTPHSFVLRPLDPAAPQAAPSLTLVGSHGADLSQYVGEKVQVSGVIEGRRGPEERSEGRGPAAATRMTVQDIQPLAASCSAAPGAGTTSPPNATSTGTPPNATSTGTTSPDATPTATTTTGSSGVTGVSGDAMLDGLFNLNIQQLLVSIQLSLNLQDAVINVNDVLNGFQIQALVQALNSNPVALLNANNLSFALQHAGLLAPGETVVGVTPPTIRDNKTLTQTLQQQGILLPGERVVGAKGARVYKMKS